MERGIILWRMVNVFNSTLKCRIKNFPVLCVHYTVLKACGSVCYRYVLVTAKVMTVIRYLFLLVRVHYYNF